MNTKFLTIALLIASFQTGCLFSSNTQKAPAKQEIEESLDSLHAEENSDSFAVTPESQSEITEEFEELEEYDENDYKDKSGYREDDPE